MSELILLLTNAILIINKWHFSQTKIFFLIELLFLVRETVKHIS